MLGRLAALTSALAIAACCHNGGREVTHAGDAAQEVLAARSFPEIKVPSVAGQGEAAAEYLAAHFWDSFFSASGEWLCDSTHIAGVPDREFATELASYLSILQNSCTIETARKGTGSLFSLLEAYQKQHPESNAFDKITEAVSYYLYDPNSDIRSEDMYLPFVRGMASSELVKPEMKQAYEYDVRMCSLNAFGTPAADFVFVDKTGRNRTMHEIKADYTVMVFVNPGCKACGEAVEAFTAPYVEQFIREGKLAVLDIYIDEDIDKWRDSAADLPESWISGYDPNFIIRKDQIYNVRAIPSIYLLDSDKHVILKDAPARRVLNHLMSVI